MRTTLDIDAAVLAAARALARDTRVSLGEAISELARRGLRAARVPAHRDGFPVFPVPADADPLSLDQVNEHRDDR